MLILLILHILGNLCITSTHFCLLSSKFVEQKVNVSRVKLLQGKHLPCSSSPRGTIDTSLEVLSLLLRLLLRQQQKRDTWMKVDRYRVLLPHPYIHRVLLHDVLDTEDRVHRKNSILYSSVFVNLCYALVRPKYKK